MVLIGWVTARERAARTAPLAALVALGGRRLLLLVLDRSELRLRVAAAVVARVRADALGLRVEHACPDEARQARAPGRQCAGAGALDAVQDVPA
jgi:hypothetical protein